MGHTIKRCKQPIKDEKGGDMENDGGIGGEPGGGDGGWEQPGATGGSGQPEWESDNAKTPGFGSSTPSTTVVGCW
jgi:hypothetical protein